MKTTPHPERRKKGIFSQPPPPTDVCVLNKNDDLCQTQTSNVPDPPVVPKKKEKLTKLRNRKKGRIKEVEKKETQMPPFAVWLMIRFPFQLQCVVVSISYKTKTRIKRKKKEGKKKTCHKKENELEVGAVSCREGCETGGKSVLV